MSTKTKSDVAFKVTTSTRKDDLLKVLSDEIDKKFSSFKKGDEVKQTVINSVDDVFEFNMKILPRGTLETPTVKGVVVDVLHARALKVRGKLETFHSILWLDTERKSMLFTRKKNEKVHADANSKRIGEVINYILTKARKDYTPVKPENKTKMKFEIPSALEVVSVVPGNELKLESCDSKCCCSYPWYKKLWDYIKLFFKS